MRTATAAPPGPVHFELPQSETTREAGDYVAEPPLLPNIVNSRPDRADLKPALDMLRRAKRPILMVGLGVFWDGASAELVRLAERLGAPVLTTSKCKGAIPEDHPLRAGCIIGGLIERNLVNAGRPHRRGGPRRRRAAAQALALHAARAGAVLARRASMPSCPPTRRSWATSNRCWPALAEWAPEGGNWGEKAAKTFRQQVSEALDTPSTGLSPQRAVEVARAVLPRDTIATCDAGASRLLVVQKWQAYGPREFLTSNGLGSMGYAVPGAHGRAARASRSAHRGLRRRRRLPDGGGRAADGAAREAAHHRRRVRRPGDRPHPRQAGDQGHPAARREARRRRLGEAGLRLRRRRRRWWRPSRPSATRSPPRSSPAARP